LIKKYKELIFLMLSKSFMTNWLLRLLNLLILKNKNWKLLIWLNPEVRLHFHRLTFKLKILWIMVKLWPETATPSLKLERYFKLFIKNALLNKKPSCKRYSKSNSQTNNFWLQILKL